MTLLARLTTGSPFSRAHGSSTVSVGAWVANLRGGIRDVATTHEGGGADRAATSGPPDVVPLQWIASKMLNIGMYSAMTMPPTMAPITPIMSGSIIAVSDCVVDSTSVS